MRFFAALLLVALAAPSAAHHSWFSRTWRWMTGAKESGDQCLVSCAPGSAEDGATCGLMWTSLVDVLTGRQEPLPTNFLDARRRKRDVLTEVQARQAKRRACCFLTEFPSALERCCGLLRSVCNSLPYDEDEDTDSRLDKLTNGVRGIADKIGVNIDDLGLSWDEKRKMEEQLIE